MTKTTIRKLKESTGERMQISDANVEELADKLAKRSIEFEEMGLGGATASQIQAAVVMLATLGSKLPSKGKLSDKADVNVGMAQEFIDVAKEWKRVHGYDGGTTNSAPPDAAERVSRYLNDRSKFSRELRKIGK